MTASTRLLEFLEGLDRIGEKTGLYRALDDIDFITGRIGTWWRRVPGWIPIVLIFVGVETADTGRILLPTLIAYATIYLIAYTWPRRWLLDIILAVLLGTATVNFVLMHFETLRHLFGVYA